jgi:hypothetical protein
MLGGGLLLLSHWTGAEPMGPMQPLPLPTGLVLGSRKLNSELAADCGQMTGYSEVELWELLAIAQWIREGEFLGRKQFSCHGWKRAEEPLCWE